MQKNINSPIILFCDIVEFSRSSSDHQTKLISDLSRFANKRLKANRIKQTIKLSTGDGFLLVCFNTDIEHILILSFQLHEWAYQKSQQIRIGINSGDVSIVKDINNRKNCVGYAVNKTERLMNVANGRQTLIDSSLRRELFGAKKDYIVEGFKVGFSKELQVFVKHYENLSVCKVLLEDTKFAWYQGDKDPISKDALVITPRPLNKPIEGSFFEQLSVAEELAFIQLNGLRLFEAISKNDILAKNTKLEVLWVCMPHPDSALIKGGYYKHIMHQKEGVNFLTMVLKWKSYLLDLKEAKPSLDVRLLLFDDVAFLKASFIDWTKKDGKIHVSPYIWHTTVKKCPGLELEWKANEPSEVYRRYQDGLNYLVNHNENVLDHVVM